jgi:hypothetical protein
VTAISRSRGQQAIAFVATADVQRAQQIVGDVPIAVVSGLLNSKKLLRCTFGDNLERRQNAG